MNQTHVIVGAGPIGSGIARLLVSQGKSVRMITRSGSGPVIEGVERIAADASDAVRMSELTADSVVIYNCANPQYHRWPTDWPPIAGSLLNAAERSGAVLVTIANLYVYGPATESLGVPAYDRDHPMTEQTPLAAVGTKGRVRRRMWLDALALHEAGRIRAAEIRSSDYIGPDAQSVIGDRVIDPLLRGKAVWIPGRTDRLHTLTFTGDVARLAVAVAAEPEAHGRVWHTPSNEARTARQTLDDLARLAGAPQPNIRTIPDAGLAAVGLFSPMMRELRETNYQRNYDFVMDSSAAERAFGLAPTPWDTVLRAVLAPSDNEASLPLLAATARRG